MEYDGKTTKFGVYVSRPEYETPAGFRDFLESAARAGYERITSVMQADLESGKISVQ
jgi:hypothetical protein